jgi:hypothetical protein
LPHRREEAEKEVIKILKDPNRNILLVLNNRVYVHREFYERSKHPGHAVMVREACQLLGCPNVIYCVGIALQSGALLSGYGRG